MKTESKTTLHIIRGLPGSGKSTLAKTLVSEGAADMHYEADMWIDYSLPFDKERTKLAHKICAESTRKALEEGCNTVVSNTFTMKWEVDIYREIAEQSGAAIKISTAHGEFKNIHNVPGDVIDAMRQRWEEV